MSPDIHGAFFMPGVRFALFGRTLFRDEGNASFCHAARNACRFGGSRLYQNKNTAQNRSVPGFNGQSRGNHGRIECLFLGACTQRHSGFGVSFRITKQNTAQISQNSTFCGRDMADHLRIAGGNLLIPASNTKGGWRTSPTPDLNAISLPFRPYLRLRPGSPCPDWRPYLPHPKDWTE